jgi:two-component system, NarL family, invasion response regulator UvrY
LKIPTTGNFMRHVPESNNTSMLNVLITDDHKIVRQGLIQILEESPEIELIHEAGNGNELLEKIQAHDYHIILLDISMPGRSGLELLKEIKKVKPEVSVIMVSIHAEDQYASCAMKFGASGYITKCNAPEELLTAIQKVASGEQYFSDALTRQS